MNLERILFIDRDGTVIREPADFQIDTFEKFRLVPGVIPALRALIEAGYSLVMVTNQDGLGSISYPQSTFDRIQSHLLDLLESQGIVFSTIRICPHSVGDGCKCRKPKTGLLTDFLKSNSWSRERSAVIGDRPSDGELAANLGVEAYLLSSEMQWPAIVSRLTQGTRRAAHRRSTRETSVEVVVDLDADPVAEVSTGIGFFDHMLEQVSKHGGFALNIKVTGDLHIDDHHSVEDTALALGQALREALGPKRGIERYGFTLPMDESRAEAALDLSGRPYFKFEGIFAESFVGGLSTEMVPHFFQSLAEAMGATLHLKVSGENTHHQVEALFKAFARALKQAIARDERASLPSTKGVL